MLAYNNLIRGLNLGIGSTMSVLIFIAVAIIAFVFVKLFGTAAPGQRRRGEALMAGSINTTAAKWRWGVLDLVVIVFALIPVLWITSLSFKTTATLTDGNFIPREWTLDNYRTIFADRPVRPGADQLDRHRADLHRWSRWCSARWPRTRSPGSTSPARACWSASRC